MKAVKTILSIVVVLVVLVVIGVVAVALFADRAVKSAVESAGSSTLTVAVSVDKADVSILGGSLGLERIVVANPKGYEGEVMLTLEQATVRANAGSLLGDEVLIRDMRLDNMEVFIEQKALQNNLFEIVKVLRERPKATGKRLIIDNLAITDITAHMNVTGVPGQPPQSVTIEVDPITMTGLGRDERLDTAVLISKIVLAVAAGVAEKSGGILPEETVGELTNVIEKVIDLGRGIFGPKRSGGQGTQQEGGDLGKQVTEGLKDLIGGQKK